MPLTLETVFRPSFFCACLNSWVSFPQKNIERRRFPKNHQQNLKQPPKTALPPISVERLPLRIPAWERGFWPLLSPWFQLLMLQQRLRRAARAGKALDEHLGVESELWKAPDEAMGGELGCPVERVKGDRINGWVSSPIYTYNTYKWGGCIGVITLNPLILTFY